jgi:hypothetical protein
MKNLKEFKYGLLKKSINVIQKQKNFKKSKFKELKDFG